MRIHPAIAALRGDPALQRRAQHELEAAKQAWVSSPLVAAIHTGLSIYGQGRRLESCGALAALFENRAAATGFVEPIVDGLVQALRAEPLGHVPFRHSGKPGFTMLQLAQAGQATLSLALYEQPDRGSAKTIAFPDAERHETVLSGRADVRIVRRVPRREHGACLDFECLGVGPGDVLSFDGPSSTRLFDRIDGVLVTLRLGRTPNAPRPTEEFRIDTGDFVHRASGNKADSHAEMAAELLGRMGRTDAAPVLERMARRGPAHTRWQALRECLALDPVRGFRALGLVAGEPEDELAVPAGALRAQLLETHPQLEESECRA